LIILTASSAVKACAIVSCQLRAVGAFGNFVE